MPNLVMLFLAGYNFALRMDSETRTFWVFLCMCAWGGQTRLFGFKKNFPVFWWLIYGRVQEIIEHLKKAKTEIRDWVRIPFAFLNSHLQLQHIQILCCQVILELVNNHSLLDYSLSRTLVNLMSHMIVMDGEISSRIGMFTQIVEMYSTL